MKCSCLSALSQSKLKIAFSQRKQLSALPAKRRSVAAAAVSALPPVREGEENFDKFLVLTSEAKNLLVKQSMDQNWALKILHLFLAFYKQATIEPSLGLNANPDDMDVEEKDEGTPMSQPGRLRGCSVGSVEDFKLGPSIDFDSRDHKMIRRSKPMDLSTLHKTSILSPLRHTGGSCFKINDTSHPSYRSMQALITEYELRKHLTTVDSKGRMITVEGKTLAFSVVSPFVNVKTLSTVSWDKSGLQRSDVCVTARVSLEFLPIGVRLNKTNEKLLLVWGTSGLNLLVLNQNGIGVAKTVSICLEMESCMSETVVDVMWVPGSESCFVVATTNCVKYYDITCVWSANEISEPLPLIFFVMSYEVEDEDGGRKFIKSMTILPPPGPSEIKRLSKPRTFSDPNSDGSNAMDEGDDDDDDDDDKDDEDEEVYIEEEQEWDCTVVVMLNDGRICAEPILRHILRDDDDDGERFIEADDCLDIPEISADAGAPNKGLGGFGNKKGGEIYFNSGSGLLCSSWKDGNVLMMKLNLSSVKIEYCFEVLPSKITELHTLGQKGAPYAVASSKITGPFGGFVELPQNEHGYHRFACYGFAGKNARLVAVEYGEDRTIVEELMWPRKTSSLSTVAASVIEGIDVFTLPSQTKTGVFVERAYLSVLQCGTGSAISSLMMWAEGGGNEGELRREGNAVQVVEDELTGKVRLIDGWSEANSKIPPTTITTNPFRTRFARAPYPNPFHYSLRSSQFKIVPGIKSRILNASNFDCTIANYSTYRPSFDLQIFETLEKIAGDCLVIKGDMVKGTSKEVIERSMEFSKSESYFSGSADSNCMAVTIDSSNDEKLKGKVLVAVRILVGASSTEYTPSKFSVMGREKRISSSGRRWHDFPLTDEEIKLAEIQGFLSMSFGSSLETAGAFRLDAIEFYVKDRNDIPGLDDFYVVGGILEGSAFKKENSSEKGKEKEEKQEPTKEKVVRVSDFLLGVGDGSKSSVISGLIFATKCLVELGKMNGWEVLKTEVGKEVLEALGGLGGAWESGVLGLLLKCSALDACETDDGEGLRASVVELLGQLVESKEKKEAIVDISTYHGAQLAISDLWTSVKDGGVELFSDVVEVSGGSKKKGSAKKNSGGENALNGGGKKWIKRFEKCLLVLGDICRLRPQNYILAKGDEKLTAFDKSKDLMNDARVIKAINRGKKGVWRRTVGLLVNLLVYEWKAGYGIEVKDFLGRFDKLGDKVISMEALGSVLYEPTRAREAELAKAKKEDDCKVLIKSGGAGKVKYR